MSDQIIGVIVLIFGIWGLFVSFQFLHRIRNWIKRFFFLSMPLGIAIVGIMFICENLGYENMIIIDFVVKILFPIDLILAGILSLWVSYDIEYIKVCVDFEKRLLFNLLPVGSEKYYKNFHIASSTCLVFAGLFLIYLFWIMKP